MRAAFDGMGQVRRRPETPAVPAIGADTACVERRHTGPSPGRLKLVRRHLAEGTPVDLRATTDTDNGSIRRSEQDALA